MKHFLKKKDLCIKGFTLTQFPNVIAPLSLGKMNNLTSFTFAEIIDLLSDGPIEGLVNKFGDKLSDENLLEGVYFNEVPVKESSSTNKLSVPIDFLTKALKDFWNCNDTQDPKIINGDFIQKIIEPREIDDPNFTVNTLQKIQITSYHPSASIRAYINEIGGDLKNAPLIEKIFDLSPTISERPFFTKIFIPDFDIFLPDYIFYDEENADFPLKAEIINLSDFIYFSITSDNFNSFNYFELPRSYARNNAVSKTGKKTIYFTKITDSNTPAGFSKCRISNLNLYIWSIYSLEYGIKKIKDILESSFKYIYIYKNNSSLYNFSFTDVELKNGSEFQSPLKYFSEVNIDTDYNKELLGPYKLTNSANLSNLSTSASNQVLDVDVENIIINVLGNRPTANSSNILIKAAEYTKQVEYDSKAKKITDVLSNLPLTLTNAELESKITTILGKRPVTPAEFTNAASQQGGGLFQNFIPKISAQLANTTSSWDAKAALLRNSIVRRIPHSSSAELGPGGVQRVISFQDGGLGTVNLDILTETSDDIRYISIWPQEYGASGSVWAICDAQPNYAAIDKNAIERKSQDAIPVTHYINNPNVEKAFITLNIQQLSDTNHIDLVDDSVTDLDNTKDKMTKQENTSSPPDGTPTYGELPGVTNIPAGQVSSRYFLVLQSKTDATLKYVIDSSTSLDLIFKNLKDLLTLPIVLTSSAATIQGTTELISLTYSTEGLGKIIPSISSIIVPTKDSIKATYNATSTNKLQNYIVPTKYNIFPTPSFNLQNYIDTATNISKNLYGVTNSLDSLLKTKNPSNNSLLLYNFGLRDKEYIYSLSTTPTEVKLPDINTGTEFSLKVYEYQIIQKQSTFTYASVAAVSISKFIAYNNYFNLLSGSDTFAEKDNTLIAKNYPYIYKYIVVKLRNQIIYLLDKIKSTSSTIQTNTKKTFIDSLSDPLKSIFNIFLIGINYEYLVAQTNFWTGTVGSSYLTQDALEALLRDYALLSGDSYPYFLSYQKFSDPIITDKLRNILNTFDQKILLNKTIFDFGITYPVNTISKSTNIYRSDFIKNNTFDTSLIYLKNSSYNLANNTYDAIIDYSMFSDQESELLTQSVNRTPHWVFSDRTKQDANPSDTWTSATQLKCVVQTLAAGTLMPAVVSIKVDTGYESSLDGNQQIYSSCRYDIFGLSNGPALIDLGSTNFSNIKTTELISPRFSITDCASYSYNQNQYLS
jgi:hypothetical protein